MLERERERDPTRKGECPQIILASFSKDNKRGKGEHGLVLTFQISATLSCLTIGSSIKRFADGSIGSPLAAKVFLMSSPPSGKYRGKIISSHARL